MRVSCAQCGKAFFEEVFEYRKVASIKDQLISKCRFGVFNFLQKTNENKST